MGWWSLLVLVPMNCGSLVQSQASLACLPLLQCHHECSNVKGRKGKNVPMFGTGKRSAMESKSTIKPSMKVAFCQRSALLCNGVLLLLLFSCFHQKIETAAYVDINFYPPPKPGRRRCSARSDDTGTKHPNTSINIPEGDGIFFTFFCGPVFFPVSTI